MKKTIAILLASASLASALEMTELFHTTDYTCEIDLSTKELGDTNNFTFVITLDPEKLGVLTDNPYKHYLFQVETGVAGGLGLLYWSDTPQFGITRGTGSLTGATTKLPSFNWSDVAGVALTLTTQEDGYKDKIQLHACILGKDGEEILNTSYTEKELGSGYNPVFFGMVNMTELVHSATGYQGTASPEEALTLAKQAAMSQNVPEPTTATLSLLALAGLATRRRRK